MCCSSRSSQLTATNSEVQRREETEETVNLCVRDPQCGILIASNIAETETRLLLAGRSRRSSKEKERLIEERGE